MRKKLISGEYKEVNIVVSIQKDHEAEKYRIITIYPRKKENNYKIIWYGPIKRTI